WYGVALLCAATVILLVECSRPTPAIGLAPSAPVNPVFNSSSAVPTDNRTFARNATAGSLSDDFTEDAALASAMNVFEADKNHRHFLRLRRHHHHHHHHHGHYYGDTESEDPSGGGLITGPVFRILGSLDSSLCVSKLVCEVVARRGIHGFIGTLIGDLFMSMKESPTDTVAHRLWRAAAIGKHGWLPVCTSAFPECSTGLPHLLPSLFPIARLLG
ncbi:unnamed protein product, partial [Ixodes hexagonus]